MFFTFLGHQAKFSTNLVTFVLVSIYFLTVDRHALVLMAISMLNNANGIRLTNMEMLYRLTVARYSQLIIKLYTV